MNGVSCSTSTNCESAIIVEKNIGETGSDKKGDARSHHSRIEKWSLHNSVLLESRKKKRSNNFQTGRITQFAKNRLISKKPEEEIRNKFSILDKGKSPNLAKFQRRSKSEVIEAEIIELLAVEEILLPENCSEV
jgi:hypothetical protein